ncbi:MAG: 50S ribosomal protein L29 [Rhodobacteraceae bacterium]|nr:50S ribosomal protein L29 [Paracoccaceae bacterium]
MKAAELREKTIDELSDDLLKLKQELFNIRFQLVSGAFTNTARIRVVRRDVARVKTVLQEKRTGEEAA